MRKFYSLIAATALAATSAFAVPADVSPDDIVLNPTSDSGWTKYSGTGNSGTTFVSTTAHKPAGADYSYSMWNYSATQKNLWLSTPAMELTEGVSYNLELMYQTWESFKLPSFSIYIADSPVSDAATAAAAEALTPIYSSEITGNQNKWFPLEVENAISGSGTKYVVFHVSGECQGRFSIANVLVYGHASHAAAPLAPTGLTAEAAPGELNVTLNWTLPTENTAGEALTGENAITGVDIYRDDEKIATVEGAATTYTDTEATGLTSGAHSYSVAAVAGTVAGARSEAVSLSWVGPWKFTQREVTVSSDNPAPDDAWSYSRNNTSFIVRSNSANPGEGFTNSVQTWNNALLSDIDAWISSPRLDVPAGRTFKLSFYYRFNPNQDTEIGSLKAYLSGSRASESASAAEAAKNGRVVLDVSAAKGDVNNSTPWQHVVVKGLTSDETPLYLNFNVSGNACKGIFISGLEVEEYVEKPFEPSAASNLSATAAPNQKLEVSLSWTNPTTDVDGVAFTPEQTIEQVLIYRDDFETPAATIEGSATEYIDNAESGLTPGRHVYKVKVMAGGGVSAFSNEAEVAYVGPAATQPLPWTPALAGLSNDEFSTLWISYSPLAAATRWTNRQVGIFMMNNTYRTADNWLISAPLDMADGEGYKAAYTINTSATEFVPDLEIGIVDSTTPESFLVSSKVVLGEETSCTLDLSTAEALVLSAGNADYRLAIRDITADPSTSYSLSVVYLHVEKDIDTGVESAVSGEAEVTAVYDLQGRRVATSLRSLPAGIYIVRYSDGTSRKAVSNCY